MAGEPADRPAHHRPRPEPGAAGRPHGRARRAGGRRAVPRPVRRAGDRPARDRAHAFGAVRRRRSRPGHRAARRPGLPRPAAAGPAGESARSGATGRLAAGDRRRSRHRRRVRLGAGRELPARRSARPALDAARALRADRPRTAADAHARGRQPSAAPAGVLRDAAAGSACGQGDQALRARRLLPHPHARRTARHPGRPARGGPGHRARRRGPGAVERRRVRRRAGPGGAPVGAG